MLLDQIKEALPLIEKQDYLPEDKCELYLEIIAKLEFSIEELNKKKKDLEVKLLIDKHRDVVRLAFEKYVRELACLPYYE